jgi:hypothetical protein
VFVSSDRAPPAALTARARELWEHLAGTAAGFAPAVSIAVSPQSALCPPGWTGIVVIGDAALATAPDRETARQAGQALSGLPAASLTSTGVLTSRLPVAEIRGPAALAYLDPAEFRPGSGDATIVTLGPGDPGLRQFLLAADAGDLEESGLEGITSSVFAVCEHGQIAAAAGYRDWPGGTAHLCVLTAAWPALPPRRPSPTRSGKASCRNGGRGWRHPGASPEPWDSANSAPR